MSSVVLRVVPIATCALMIVGCAEREAPPPKSTPERPVIIETEVGVSDHEVMPAVPAGPVISK
jgi:hypothetical protein